MGPEDWHTAASLYTPQGSSSSTVICSQKHVYAEDTTLARAGSHTAAVVLEHSRHQLGRLVHKDESWYLSGPDGPQEGRPIRGT